MRWMLALVVGLLACVAVEPAAAEPIESLESKAADAVVRAHAAQEAGSLRALATSKATDPWRIAQHLLLRGEHEAAQALAAAVPAVPDTAKLAAYVGAAKNRKLPDHRAALQAVWQAETPAAAAELAAKVPLDDDVFAVLVATIRGVALKRLRRMPDAHRVFLDAAAAAERIGWLRRQSAALHDATECLHRMSDFAGMQALAEQRIALAKARGDEAAEADALLSSGAALLRAGHYDEAVARCIQAVAIQEARGDKADLADALNTLGIVQYNYRRYDEAREAWTRARALAREVGKPELVAGLTVNLGNTLKRADRLEEALAAYAEGAELAQKAGVVRFQAIALDNAAGVLNALGRLKEALAMFDEALAMKRKLGNPRALGSTLANRGIVLTQLGRYEEAIAGQREAVDIASRTGDRLSLSHAQRALGEAYTRRGDSAAALRHFEAAAAAARAARHGGMLCDALYWLGWTYDHLQDKESALRAHDEAVHVATQIKSVSHRASLHRLATKIHGDVDPQLALEHASKAYELTKARGRGGDAVTLALALKELGRYEEALAHLEEAERLEREAVGDVVTVNRAKSLVNRGSVLTMLKRYQEAVPILDEAIRLAQELGASRVASKAMIERARAAFEQGDQATIVELAKRYIALQPVLVRGLSEELAAQAQERASHFLEDGARAAATLGKPAEALHILESIRAISLLESLGGRVALREVAVPEALRTREQEAVSTVRDAQSRLASAKRRSDIRRMRRARTALDEAEAELLAVVARIQRSQKSGAALLYPKAASLAAVQATLRPDEAFVTWTWADDILTCVVVTPKAARASTHAAADNARAAVDAMLAFERPPSGDDAERAPVDAARALLIEPLALPTSVRRVLITPADRVAYVPFAMLLPDREVVYVPSASTLVALRAAPRTPGRRVLALGDPAYGPGSLARLPASRAEAEAIGDVVLVGERATEDGLRAHLASGTRWRAIHLACHGLLDAERALLSSLALTPSEGADGRLTVHELLRMQVPADLVALSACETARGEVYRAEGVMGFTRALLLGGASRTLVSLWKVDDEATGALMQAFYARWHPKEGRGVPAGQALREAQAHVRAQARWKDPYFWAAWTLWGLPD